MKYLLHRITLGVILCTGTMAAADEAASRRLGDAAFYAGDFRNAISSYESAMKSAEESGNSDEWAASALNLAVSYLHHGNIAKARQLLQEFRRRFPLRSTGTLEGDLLAAEGKSAEAEKFYKAMLTNDPVSEDARLFSLASLYMDMGGEKRIAEACDIFMMIAGALPLREQLRTAEGAAASLAAGSNRDAYRKLGETFIRPDSPWRRYATTEAVYALIRLQRIGKARELLAQIPAGERNANVELLEYLADAYSDTVSKFKSNFQNFVEKLPPGANRRVTELCWMAAKVASAKQDHAFADQVLTDSVIFAPDEKSKRHLGRLQIEVRLHYAPAKAAEAAKDYIKNFPGDDTRFRLALDTAERLFVSGNFAFAVEMADFLLAQKQQNVNIAEIVRLGVFAAEKAKDFAALEKFNRRLFSNVSLADRVQFQQRYAAFLETSGKKTAAEKELREALATANNSKNIKLIENAAFVMMEFYVRLDNRSGILEMAGILEKSAEPVNAAAAKCALGDLQERSFNYLRARDYFKQVSLLPTNRYQAQAAFKAALMSYKESDFSTAAQEFFECAKKFPEYEKAPEALFMAVDLFDPEKSSLQVHQAEKMLREKYPASQAFAVFILRLATVKGRQNEEIKPLIADLLTVEKNFAGSPAAAEAALLRAVLTDKSGSTDEALKIFASLYDHQNKQLAAESLFRSGEIHFRKNQLKDARELFLRSAAKDPATIQSETAILRAVDCDLAGKMPLDSNVVSACLKELAKLTGKSKFPRIRLEAFCKTGIALEHSGDTAAALAAYEKAVYTAGDMAEQGLTPERTWCLKSCESALRLITAAAGPGAIQHGLQLIKRCGRALNDDTTIQNMRENFRKQIKNRR